MTIAGIRKDAKHTLYACYLAIVGQAVVNNFFPLLLLTFEREFGISLAGIAVLVGFNFMIQLLTDLVAAFVADRIGYRRCMVFGQACTFVGMVSLAVLPGLLHNPFLGLMIAVFLYAVGGGLAEVLVSPIVEHSPTEHKTAAMSLLHSFYCWGHVFVVVVSLLFFLVFGISNWRILAVIWALMPLFGSWYFAQVPITQAGGEGGMKGAFSLLKSPVFWLFSVMMVCSGAAEQSVSQWASAFAESGLKVSKTVGDLAGPTFFAAMMGLARVLHSRGAERRSLVHIMGYSAVLCVAAYLLIILPPAPALGLLGVGITGFSVGIFWPGTLSLAARRLPSGGTAMYALLALAGDLGCSAGPSVVGFVSDLAGGELKIGFLVAMVFPLMLAVMLFWLARRRRAVART
jgi:MFS family permease